MKEKEPEAPVVTGEAQVVTEEAPVEPVKPLYQLDPKDEGTIQISTDGGATWWMEAWEVMLKYDGGLQVLEKLLAECDLLFVEMGVERRIVEVEE